MGNFQGAVKSIEYDEVARGGGGYGYSRYVDCNSALALIGFILFVDILRDFIETITTPEEEAGGGEAKRRKRWTNNGPISGEFLNFENTVGVEPDLVAFVNGGGNYHLYHSLPKVLGPLVDGWWTSSNKEHSNDCLLQSVCQANFVLAREYGVAGRIFATLLSNVGSHALKGLDGELLNVFKEAAKTGRRRIVPCDEAYPNCPRLSLSYHQRRYYNITNAIVK